MPYCTTCGSALRTVRQREGIYFFCDGCASRAVTVPQIRRVTGDRVATDLLRKINRATMLGERRCPFCSRPMLRFDLEEPEMQLDACKPCNLIWFDAREFESLPEGAVESVEELELRGREALAVHKVEMLTEESRRAAGTGGEPPEEAWKWIPAIFGLPVEMENPGLSRWPWVTWSTAIAITVLSLWAFFDLEKAVDRFGFIPAQAWREGGATLLTSFFLHAGLWHLASNLYFLLLVGDNAEDYLGRWRYLLLILISTLCGDLLHLVTQPHSMIPSIGASGGISGIMAFYVLEFPRVRLGFLLRFFWVQIPAWGFFAFWMVLQGFGAWTQLHDEGQIDCFAHLGGVVAGVAAWLYWRKLNRDL